MQQSIEDNKNHNKNVNAYVAEQIRNFGERWFNRVKDTHFDSFLAFSYREQNLIFEECLNNYAAKRNLYDKNKRSIKKYNDLNININNYFNNK